MDNQIILYTQLVSIVGFIVALFSIYKTLINNKDAMISLLREQNENLKSDILNLENQQPDVLVDRYAHRLSLMNNELNLLLNDHNTNQNEIKNKEKEIEYTKKELLEYKNKFDHANRLIAKYLSSKEFNKLANVSSYELTHSVSQIGNHSIDTAWELINLIELTKNIDEIEKKIFIKILEKNIDEISDLIDISSDKFKKHFDKIMDLKEMAKHIEKKELFINESRLNLK